MNNKKIILLIDNDLELLEIIKHYLEVHGFNIITLSINNNLIEKISNSISVIITELFMPEGIGFDLIKKIRNNHKTFNIPIIVLTKETDETLEIKALNNGANDFLRKPVSLKTLLARINSKLKKVNHSTTSAAVIKSRVVFDEIVVDVNSHKVLICKNDIYFPRKEFFLLHLLLCNPGKVFKRENLLTEIWGIDISVVDRTVDVHIRRIRAKLGEYSKIIKTIKGVGYKFDPGSIKE